MDERRRALRAPVRGAAVLHSEEGRSQGTLENLSETGVLLRVPRPLQPPDAVVELELRLLGGGGWIRGRTVRVAAAPHDWEVAVAFDALEPATRERIVAAIDAARSSVTHRPVLVIDDRVPRRTALVRALAGCGLMPLVPATPLEAIDYLTRTKLHVEVCLLARAFDLPQREIAEVLADSFPWVKTQEIDDDLEATLARACAAWSSSSVARLATAIA